MMRWIFYIIMLLVPAIVHAECNFKTSNYRSSLMAPSSIKRISVEVPKSSKFARNQFKILASESRNIPDELKKDFKARIGVHYDFGSCLYEGKVRQNGDLKDHIQLVTGGQVIQSLDVKLETGNVLNAISFKLLIPHTRNGANEVLATTILRELGFIAPETFEVNALINGVQSVMIFQEKAAKELLERNLRREGPIFRGDEVLMWSYKNFENIELDRLSLSTLYNRKWFEKGDSSQRIVLNAYETLQIASLKSRYHQRMQGQRYYFIPDTKSAMLYNDFMGVIAAMNGYHALFLNNRKHYFNAILGMFEPIYYDGNVDFKKDWGEKSNVYVNPVMLSDYLVDKIGRLETSQQLKAEFLERIINHSNAGIFFDESLSQFKKNIKGIQISNGISSAHINSFGNIKITEYSSWYNHLQDEKGLEQKVIVDIEAKGSSYWATFDDQSTEPLSKSDVLSIVSENNLNGQRVVYIPRVSDHSHRAGDDFDDFSVLDIKLRKSQGISFSFDVDQKELIFQQEDPSDWVLIYNSDLRGWSVALHGQHFDPTKPTDKQRFNAYGLTGCLTIYNSDVSEATLSVSKGQCEDSLNLVNVSGSRIEISIDESYADAVDADFSLLDVVRLKVNGAGNDCFDVSGGEYFVGVSELKNCGDKGISVGEKSVFKGEKVTIENAFIGISSKDLSSTFVKTFTAAHVLVCGEANRKKQEFGGGELRIDHASCGARYSVDAESLVSVGSN